MNGYFSIWFLFSFLKILLKNSKIVFVRFVTGLEFKINDIIYCTDLFKTKINELSKLIIIFNLFLFNFKTVKV